MATKVKTEIIDNYRKENNLTIAQFCKKCGMSTHIYYKFMRSELKMRASYLVKITRVLKIPCEDILFTTD